MKKEGPVQSAGTCLYSDGSSFAAASGSDEERGLGWVWCISSNFTRQERYRDL